MGCYLGSFWESKSAQNATYVRCVCVCVCAGACVLELFSVLFSLRFLHRFLDVFCIDFGVILEPFWEALGGPNRSFLVSIF